MSFVLSRERSEDKRQVSESNPSVETPVAEPPASKPLQPKIREARFEDYSQIASVVQRNGLGFKAEEQWRHLWADNPVYQSLQDCPIGWVAVNPDDDRIVGYLGNIVTGFSIEGERVVCISSYALALDPPYRRVAGFIGRRCRNQKNAEMHIITSANSKSFAMAQGPMTGSHVPAGDWQNSVYWITDYRGFAASALAMKNLPRIASYPAALAMGIRESLRGNPFRAEGRQSQLIECTTFDERFDDFWNDLKRAYPHRLLADRSREVLLWHFKYPLLQDRVWILTTRHKSAISTYAVFCRIDNVRIGLKRMRLVDFQTLDGDPQMLAPMLAWAYHRCKREGIHMLEASGFRPEKEAVISRFHPHRRQLPNWFYFYWTRNKELAARLTNPDAWDPCHYDGDSSL